MSHGQQPSQATLPAGTPRITCPIDLPALPYAEDALAPTISARTMSFHYGKHHRAYVDNLNRLRQGTIADSLTLDKIIEETADNPKEVAIFNNAAQVWNHTFFWKSMKPKGGGKPTGPLMDMIVTSFGSFDDFKKAFVDAAVGRFGSGWAWLVLENGKLKVVTTSNSELPRAPGQTPLLTCDVWEHAYYLDYQNDRRTFVTAFLDNLANWDFAASQLPK
ncbi:MAG: superoxide dismutase [Fe] [Verrucomicrobia bacterium]|nr:superoxide dismutase [Fe] [Verrucomicrobiota bacterium]